MKQFLSLLLVCGLLFTFVNTTYGEEHGIIGGADHPTMIWISDSDEETLDWTLPDDPAIADIAETVFYEAMTNWNDMPMTPYLLLASSEHQFSVIYCYLCRSENDWLMVYIEQDLKGDCIVTSVLPVIL